MYTRRRGRALRSGLPFLLLLVGSVAAAAFVVTMGERPLYVAEGEQLDPRISGVSTVFTDLSQGGGDILLIADVKLWHLLTPLPLAALGFCAALLCQPSKLQRLAAFLRPEKWADHT